MPSRKKNASHGRVANRRAKMIYCTRHARDLGKTAGIFPAIRTVKPDRAAGRGELTSGTRCSVSHVSALAARRALETRPASPGDQVPGKLSTIGRGLPCLLTPLLFPL